MYLESTNESFVQLLQSQISSCLNITLLTVSGKTQGSERAKGFGIFGSGVDSDCDKCYLRFYTGQVCLGLTSGVRVCNMMGWVEQKPRSSPLTGPESHCC